LTSLNIKTVNFFNFYSIIHSNINLVFILRGDREHKLRSALLVLLLSANGATCYAKSDVEVAGDVLQLLVPAVGYGMTFQKDDPEGRTQFYKSAATTFVVTHERHFRGQVLSTPVMALRRHGPLMLLPLSWLTAEWTAIDTTSAM
jgi:hypothetical protein